MNIIIKKIIRITTYSIVVAIVGLFGFLISRKKSDHSITLDPLKSDYSITQNPLAGIPYAFAESGDGAGDKESSDGGGSSSAGSSSAGDADSM